MNPTNYFAAIRQQRTTLDSQFSDGACLVTSIRLPGRQCTAGVVCEVSLDIAARLLVEGTHRLASEEEAHAFHEEQEFKRTPYGDPLAEARIRFGLLTSKKGDI